MVFRKNSSFFALFGFSLYFGKEIAFFSGRVFKKRGAVSLRIHIDQGKDGKNTVRVFASANS